MSDKVTELNNTITKEEPKELSALNTCVIPLSVTSGFDKFFDGKFVRITGIDLYFVQYIHNWLHDFGSLYEYKEGCEVVIIVGKNVPQKRLKAFNRKFPNATFIDFNRELSEFVNCNYESAITLSPRENKYSFSSAEESKSEEESPSGNIVFKIIAGIITAAIVIAMLYFGLGLFILLMIFFPGVAKALLKGFLK